MIGPFFPRAFIPQQRGSRSQCRFRGSIVDEDDDEQLIVLEEVLHENLGRLDCPYQKEERIFRLTGSRKDRYYATRRRRRRPFAGPALILVATAAAFLVILVSTVAGTTNDKEENSRKTVTKDAIDFLDIRSRFGGDAGGVVDLLAALQLHNTTHEGITQVPGLARLKPAYYLQGEERELRLSETNFQKAASLLRRVPEFTMVAILRQEEENSGTIIAFSHGNNRYLELQSSGRRDELRLHYVSRQDGAVHVEEFPFRLADGAWHKVALSISGSQVELLIDCHPLYRRLLRPGPPDTNFTLPLLQLWIGQRNARHFLFKASCAIGPDL
ncbi:protein kinase C-binding protein NELL1-like isoform X2 [Belonocnema kinseyi]|uniref:protein kinase C-binding protein NELL1-like isoform X2 n=1 Tax=Belonocnema kinseyi TaxID=2817044 RepID=UPI00143D9B65|nr:protein kinase C-binding protein NELL1-like isoform X2 [Belonocnema kinseyi]